MMNLQQSGKKDNYTPYGGVSFQAKQGGKEREMDITGEGVMLPHVQKISSSNQDQTDKPLLDKEIRPALSTPRKARPERRYE